MWHKLYSSARRSANRNKAEKDLRQAATLAAILVEVDDLVLEQSLSEAPRDVWAGARSRMPSLKAMLQSHPQALEQMEMALALARVRSG